MDIHTVLVIAHVAGAILGVGGATIAEVNVMRALKKDGISEDEKYLMHGTYMVIRIGTLLALLSGVALIWWIYLVEGRDWPLYSAKIWVKDVMLLVIVFNAWFLTKRWIPLWLGSALSFTSWWGATILGLWRTPYSFWELIAGYVVAIAVVAVILQMIRKYVARK